MKTIINIKENMLFAEFRIELLNISYYEFKRLFSNGSTLRNKSFIGLKWMNATINQHLMSPHIRLQHFLVS